jgi:RNA polymerase sigma-70 factor (ECF subfamily)
MGREFIDVFDDHGSYLYGFFAYRLGSRADAEDLTQTTFERALRAWPRFDPLRASERTWLVSIARNLLVDHYRAAAARPAPSAAGLEDALGSARGPEDDAGIEPDLADAIATLGDRERELLALRFGGDLSGPQIAAECGLTLANVQQILSRALRKLRVRLDPAASGRERAHAGEAGGGDEQQRGA